MTVLLGESLVNHGGLSDGPFSLIYSLSTLCFIRFMNSLPAGYSRDDLTLRPKYDSAQVYPD